MAIDLKQKKKRLLLFLVILGFLSSFYYLSWWNDKIINRPLFILPFSIVLFYIIVQVYFLWIIYLNARYPGKAKGKRDFKVDVFLPTYNEPV